MKPYPAQVTWIDAYSNNTIHVNKKEIDETPDIINVSIGFVVESTRRRIVLAGTIEPDSEHRDVLFIPRCQVCKVKRLR
jgi:hypothetical protein